MAYIYATNSPQYLEYVTRNLSRKQLLAHPIFCQWMNSVYTKDNMEIAIRFNEAEDGDFNDKKAFVEYFMCNGPELDADTLLYYRKKILHDDSYREIAYTYYANLDVVDSIREKVYNKSYMYTGSDGQQKQNCFKAPCSYLGPISCSSLLWEEAGRTSSTSGNAVADRRGVEMLKPSGENHTIAAVGPANPTAIPQTEKTNDSKTADTKSTLPSWVESMFHPSQMEKYYQYIEQRNVQTQQLCEDLALKHHLIKTQMGDHWAMRFGEAWRLLVVANNKRHNGDCDRILRQMAGFNPYDPTMNKRRPITDLEIVAGTAPNGQPVNQPPNPTARDATPPTAQEQIYMAQGKYKELVDYVMRRKGMSEEYVNGSAEQVLSLVYEYAFNIRNGGSSSDVVSLRNYLALYLHKTGKKLNSGWTWQMLVDHVGSRTNGLGPAEVINTAIG